MTGESASDSLISAAAAKLAVVAVFVASLDRNRAVSNAFNRSSNGPSRGKRYEFIERQQPLTPLIDRV